jgi:hypothetical protein
MGSSPYSRAHEEHPVASAGYVAGSTEGSLSVPKSTRRARLALLAILALGSLAPWLPLPASRHVPAARAQGCPVISGFVYYDINDNGVREPGEPGIAGVPMQLKNLTGATVGVATTTSTGAYAFDRDLSSSQALREQRHSAVFPETVTDWDASRSIPRFNAALGTLDSVVLTVAAEIRSAIKAESLDTGPQEIAAEVSGRITVEAPGKDVTAVPLAHAGEFAATAYDGIQDFAGTSGHDFGSATASDEAGSTVVDVASLVLYTGTGSVSITASAAATSRTTGSGNVLNEIRTVASAQVEVVYRYRPIECLAGGTYTIVEVAQPAGYGDGLETRGNDSAIPGTRGTDVITVTLDGEDLPENNFGEIAASLHGCVYVDANENGRRDAGEAAIPGVTITLTGAAGRTTVTAGDGCYLFPQLPPGGYTITETQPTGFRDCQDSIGTQGGQVANDRLFDIRLGANVHGRNNDFGECLVATPTPTVVSTIASSEPTVTPTPTPVTSSTPGASPSVPPPSSSAVGDSTPAIPRAPGAGSGLFEGTPDVRIVIAGFAIFAASGWIAFLALGRARDRDAEP